MGNVRKWLQVGKVAWVMHFKSSLNRAPRQCTKGDPGEEFELYLELKVLADVGLLGMPNAGKSTFIRSVSAAKPKVADYPVYDSTSEFRCGAWMLSAAS